MDSGGLRLSIVGSLMFLYTLATLALIIEVTKLDRKLEVYKELTSIYDVKEYCKKKVRAPNRCNITVSINNIGGK